MIPPALAIVWLGDRRAVPLPVPLFLLWPLGLAAVVACSMVAWIAPSGGDTRQAARIGIAALGVAARVSGLRVDVRQREGHAVRIWVV